MTRIPTYRPQLAQLVKTAPSGADWVHEPKYDGYRIGCRVERGRATLISRNGKDWTNAFPEIADAAARLPVRTALLDGEVCVVLPDGRTSFQALQNLSREDRGRLVYFVFDLLFLDGRSLLREALDARKAALHGIIRGSRVRFAEHLQGDGPAAFREACRLGLEGIVSKQRSQPYAGGKRVGWVKTKCIQRQEFVIGGFTDPEGAREGIGALLVGTYKDGALVFGGKVGTGFSTRVARDLRRRLNQLEVPDCPFTPRPAGWLGKHAHWVRPELVAEATFTEWTDEGKIRHPSFQGLREDKSPADVVREVPAGGRISIFDFENRDPTPTARHGRVENRDPTPSVRGVRISNPNRIMYPTPTITKLDVVNYYDAIADAMLPHVEGRPLTLVRCGTGIDGDCIFMKHSKLWAPAALTRVKIKEKTKVGDYLVIESPAALISLAQMDVLEIHTWNTRYTKVEYPDRIVLDLDPGPQVDWAAVVAAGTLVRGMLRTLGLDSWAKTTGGRGLHVVVPIEPRHEWTACLDFARAAAEALVRHDPTQFTTAFAKRGRERLILVDYMRNNRTNTSIAAFSTRARAGAPVSMPIAWSELTPRLDPGALTLATTPARLRRQKTDPWAGYFTARQRLSKRAVAALDALAP
jgi:bifunctional non-homologous end joining protein LigD